VPSIAAAVAAGEISVPIAASFPLDQIREAVTLQSGRRVHGKVVITL
jgi:NADPH:quinone reductase-like Zn-dependent oxidoreductase